MLEITWRGMAESDALAALIRTKARKLYRFYRRIGGCRVMIEQPHHHQRVGEHFHVRIEVSVPGKELVVEREPTERSEHEDAYVAVNDAFHAMRRQLEDYIRVRRGFAKAHAPAQ